jgi:hypothetical protein
MRCELEERTARYVRVHAFMCAYVLLLSIESIKRRRTWFCRSEFMPLLRAESQAGRRNDLRSVEEMLRVTVTVNWCRWTVMHLLPAVEKSMVAIEQLLGDRAQGLVMELEDIKSSVWQKAERVRETSVRHKQKCLSVLHPSRNVPSTAC